MGYFIVRLVSRRKHEASRDVVKGKGRELMRVEGNKNKNDYFIRVVF
jgi:hypothetical protein